MLHRVSGSKDYKIILAWIWDICYINIPHLLAKINVADFVLHLRAKYGGVDALKWQFKIKIMA